MVFQDDFIPSEYLVRMVFSTTDSMISSEISRAKYAFQHRLFNEITKRSDKTRVGYTFIIDGKFCISTLQKVFQSLRDDKIFNIDYLSFWITMRLADEFFNWYLVNEDAAERWKMKLDIKKFSLTIPSSYVS